MNTMLSLPRGLTAKSLTSSRKPTLIARRFVVRAEVRLLGQFVVGACQIKDLGLPVSYTSVKVVVVEGESFGWLQ
jgi:hypothetical protein